ncbi:hypothetical protein SK128_017916 [Halocaridina rubra]|uniref:C2H2-type domain-containing protein n=1 Tax=Halocaridina rubra TaxID=373956 RepID=A0AAN9AB97_HALRR
MDREGGNGSNVALETVTSSSANLPHSFLGSTKIHCCPYCTYSTPVTSHLKDHLRTHTGEKPFGCTFCAYQASTKSNLTKHVLVRMENASYSNSGRRGEQGQIGALVTYNPTMYHSALPDSVTVASAGGGCKIHRCPYCSYSSYVSTNLQNHMRTHTGEKPYPCPKCSYSATTKDNLKKHIFIHTGEKPFPCSLCSYSTTTKGYLKRHVLAVHSDSTGDISVCAQNVHSNNNPKML